MTTKSSKKFNIYFPVFSTLASHYFIYLNQFSLKTDRVNGLWNYNTSENTRRNEAEVNIFKLSAVRTYIIPILAGSTLSHTVNPTAFQ